MLFLLEGFELLFHLRRVIKQGCTETEQLEKLMTRMGIFTLLYTVPPAQWWPAPWRSGTVAELGGCTHHVWVQHRPTAPQAGVYWVLKYFTCLMVGIM